VKHLVFVEKTPLATDYIFHTWAGRANYFKSKGGEPRLKDTVGELDEAATASSLATADERV
jgi:hypothetical protein